VNDHGSGKPGITKTGSSMTIGLHACVPRVGCISPFLPIHYRKCINDTSGTMRIAYPDHKKSNQMRLV
jgi:hypothetical protein